jgi:hypothetical protein
VEPASNEESDDGFLGSGFRRACRDYEGLKRFVEGRRAFDARGFLARGYIEQGKI